MFLVVLRMRQSAIGTVASPWHCSVANAPRRDLNMYSKGKNTQEPVAIYQGHSSVVGVCIFDFQL